MSTITVTVTIDGIQQNADWLQKICEKRILSGCYGDCRTCRYREQENTTPPTEGKLVRTKRKYDFGAKHRVTSLHGIYRIFQSRGKRAAKNLSALLRQYGAEGKNLKALIAFAEATKLPQKHLTIAETVIRDYNKGHTDFA